MKRLIAMATTLQLASSALAWAGGSSDAHEAVVGWRENAARSMTAAVFATEAHACGLRDDRWLGGVAKYVYANTELAKLRYREPVIDKPAFDLEYDRVSYQLLAWYMSASEAASRAARSPTECTSVSRNTTLLQAADFDSTHY
jgi:hypothetical protein